MDDVLLIDGNSIGFAAHSMKKLHSGGKETQAVFGTLRSIRVLLTEYPGRRPIVFWDGESWRKEKDPQYKANRDSNDKMSVERDAYRAQRPMIFRALTLLGVSQVIADNMEADDLIALTVHAKAGTGDKMTVVSGDRDLLQLVRKNVDWHNPINLPGGRIPKLRDVNEHTFAELTGYEGPAEYLQGKALLGDASDNLKGVAGIGEKAAPLILEHYKSVSAMRTAIQKDGESAIPDHLRRYRKKILDFAEFNSEGAKLFKHNIQMMGLNPSFLPKPISMRIVNQPYDEARFLKLCEDLSFLTILKTHEKWTAPFVRAQTKELESA